MFATRPKTDYSTVLGVRLTVIPKPEKSVEPLASNLKLHNGYYEIQVTNEGSNPFIGNDFDYCSIGIIQAKFSKLPWDRFLNDNTVMVLADNEELERVELIECEKTSTKSNKSYIGLWLDISFRNKLTSECDMRSVFITDYTETQHSFNKRSVN